MEQVFLEAISGHVKEKEVIGNSLFTKGNLCLTNLIAFCDETSCVKSLAKVKLDAKAWL